MNSLLSRIFIIFVLFVNSSCDFSIGGVDADQNGLRDEVESWIDSLEQDQNIKLALKSLGRIYQGMLVNANDSEKFMKYKQEYDVLRWCLKFVTFKIGSAQGNHLKNQLFEKIYDNPLRKYLHRKGWSNIPGGIYSVPDIHPMYWGLACDFKVQNSRDLLDVFLKNYKSELSQEEEIKFKELYENYPPSIDVYQLFSGRRRI